MSMRLHQKRPLVWEGGGEERGVGFCYPCLLLNLAALWSVLVRPVAATAITTPQAKEAVGRPRVENYSRDRSQ